MRFNRQHMLALVYNSLQPLLPGATDPERAWSGGCARSKASHPIPGIERGRGQV